MNLLVTWLTAQVEHCTNRSDRTQHKEPQYDRHQNCPPDDPQAKKRDRTHWLYIAVIVAVLAGIAVGLLAPEVGSALGVLGTLFVSLIKMMIAPVIFCTIVLGIGSVRKAASVGRVGGIALTYFLSMSTVALGIGLLVGNIIKPGTGLNIAADPSAGAEARGEGARIRRRDGVLRAHHPDVAAVLADRGQHPAGPVRGAAGRLRPAGDGHDRRAGAARGGSHPEAGVPDPGRHPVAGARSARSARWPRSSATPVSTPSSNWAC